LAGLVQILPGCRESRRSSACRLNRRCTFSHPDCTVGPGVTPGHAWGIKRRYLVVGTTLVVARLVGCTTGREWRAIRPVAPCPEGCANYNMCALL